MESSAASRRPSTLCRADAKGKADKKSISPPPTECQPPPLPCPRECRNPSHPSPLANTNPPIHPSPPCPLQGGRLGWGCKLLPSRRRCPRACGDPSLPPANTNPPTHPAPQPRHFPRPSHVLPSAAKSRNLVALRASHPSPPPPANKNAPSRCPRAYGTAPTHPSPREHEPANPSRVLAHAGTHPPSRTRTRQPIPSFPLPNRPRPHPSPLPIPPQTIPSYKSNHLGLPFSTNRTFHARYHFFRAFSLTLALSIDS